MGLCPYNGEVVYMKTKILRSIFVPVLFVMLTMAGCTKSSNPVSGTKMFDSGSVGPGGTFTFVFTSAMIVPYYCIYHGGRGGVGMSGTITVQAGGAPSRKAVSMAAMTFVPATMTVAVGDTVVWTNNSTVAHTVTSDN